MMHILRILVLLIVAAWCVLAITIEFVWFLFSNSIIFVWWFPSNCWQIERYYPFRLRIRYSIENALIPIFMKDKKPMTVIHCIKSTWKETIETLY